MQYYFPDTIKQHKQYFVENRYTGNIIIDWDITTICQYKCPYCYARKEKNKWGKLASKYIIQIVLKRISELHSACCISLLGGEPALHPEINFILNSLYKLEQVKEVELYTNGHTDITSLPVTSKLKITFSWHPTEVDRKLFLKHLTYAISHLTPNQVGVNIMCMPLFTNEIQQFMQWLASNNIIFEPMYIQSHNRTKIPTMQVQEIIKYMYNGKLYSTADIFRKKINDFRGWTCKKRSICIDINGMVADLCGSEPECHIQEDNSIMRFIKDVTCTKICTDECWFSAIKFKD